MRITCKNKFPFIKIAMAQEIRLHLYLFIICYECLPVYGYPGMGNMESGQILEFILSSFVNIRMSDFWLQTSQHYKIMEVPFANGDKLIGRARSIKKKRLLIKNLRRVFHIKKTVDFKNGYLRSFNFHGNLFYYSRYVGQ